MLSNWDYFGRPVKFNFNYKGPLHNTTCGGFCSILINLVYLFIVGLLVKQCVLFERDSISSVRRPSTNDQISYRDMKLMPFVTVYDPSNDMLPVDPITLASTFRFELVQTTVNVREEKPLAEIYERLTPKTWALGTCKASELFTDDERASFKAYDR